MFEFIVITLLVILLFAISKHKSKARNQPHTIPLSLKVSSITAEEALQRFRELRDSPDCIHTEVLLPEGVDERFRDPEVLWSELAKFEHDLFHQLTEQVNREIIESQSNSLGKELMIPLCVPFLDKDRAKMSGARWCSKSKAWFWPMNKERSSINQWLPRIYRTDTTSPFILPRLVPKNLWGINLRSLLPATQWNSLRKDTYERYAYRCCICGCKGTKWPVECDELWNYKTDQETPGCGTVVFEGLFALCPGCHQVKHFGKASVDGEEDTATARMRYLNKWDAANAQQRIDGAFDIWEERSQMKWAFDFSKLQQQYGIELAYGPVEPEIDIQRVNY